MGIRVKVPRESRWETEREEDIMSALCDCCTPFARRYTAWSLSVEQSDRVGMQLRLFASRVPSRLAVCEVVETIAVRSRSLSKEVSGCDELQSILSDLLVSQSRRIVMRNAHCLEYENS